MFTSILCPIDFSEPSIRALHYALALAARERCHVTLVYVTHPFLVEAAAAAYGATFVKDDAERELRNVASAAVANVRGGAPQIDIFVSVGDPASEILKCATDHHSDGIVMGTQGLSGYTLALAGISGAVVGGHATPHDWSRRLRGSVPRRGAAEQRRRATARTYGRRVFTAALET